MAKIRVRARAVDMLGRQQIAGIPTAIHELFKNAHDAYADRVEVDYFRADQLFVLRDDGFGMSRADFEGRWLTLGTESKVGANSAPTRFDTAPPGMNRRPIMGEKGIGRLAIAAIGPQVLVLTRPGKGNPTGPLVACLINWGMFELPGIDLDQIEIPVVEVGNGELPTREQLKALATRIEKNLEELGPKVSAGDKARITAELSFADFDPTQLSKLLGTPSLEGRGHGTHFFVRPANAILADDIDTKADDAASPLEKMLLGFSNTMMPNRDKVDMIAEFRDHKINGVVEELISGNSFFTPAEFLAADHHIEGKFDEFGQFSGTVAVYDQPPVQHQIAWPDAAGRVTECGPFSISFGYVQGNLRDTRLPPDEWAMISAKLNRIGGLYVYRDGIRILPYGNSDYDFLNIERRRTKSAQDWFFSYRRILGAVEISYKQNPNLVEKAGREGFRANLAYRQMTAMLENVFSRLAIDFFRPASIYGSEFNAAKNQLNKEAKLLARREASSRIRRQEFASKLSTFFGDLESGRFSNEALRILDEVKARLMALPRSADRHDEVVQAILELEAWARAQLTQLRATASITKPRGVGLSKSLQADWDAYQKNIDKIEREVFSPTEDSIFTLVSEAGAPYEIDKRRLVVVGLESKRGAATSGAARLRRDVKEQVAVLSKGVEDALQASITSLSSEIDATFVDLNRTDTSKLTSHEIRELQALWEGRIEASATQTNELLEGLRDQLGSVSAALASNETVDDLTGALEGQVDAYREQLDSYVELAQVGMALGIVQHEFSSTVRGIRGAIQKLQPWVRGTPQLGGLYSDLKSGFDHLENYLGLFTPMSRRLNRVAVDLTGEEIRTYLEEVFGDRLTRHKIKVTPTPAFLKKKVHGFASTFLPAFVNLVDNAIYWITTEVDGGRNILLDADAKSFVVANDGPGVDRRIADRVFEFGETNKPGGRGMGLYLSRQALLKEGYDLELMREGSEFPVAFRIFQRSAERIDE